MNLLAQSLQIGGQTIEGPLDPGKFNSVADIINYFMGPMAIIALLIFFVYMLMAGIELLRNFGDPALVKKGKARITNAILGIIFLAASYWAAQILQKIFF